MAFEHYNKIAGSVPESLDTHRIDLEELFSKPAPEGWRPKAGDTVYIRPGILLGGCRVNPVSVKYFSVDGAATVSVQIGRKTKTRTIALNDLRSI